METGMNMLVDELTRCPEQESELSTSIELCMRLAQEILASIDKALSIAQSSGCANLAVGHRDNPPPPRSPCSEITEWPLTAEGKEMISKKRKRQPKWSIITQFEWASRAEGEGRFDDGCSWRREYGPKPKPIPPAKYPRCCYKCINHNSLPSTLDNSCKRRSTDEFISPATSELNCFSCSPGRATGYVEPLTLQASESYFTERVSALTSTRNSSVFDRDFLFQSSESDP